MKKTSLMLAAAAGLGLRNVSIKLSLFSKKIYATVSLSGFKTSAARTIYCFAILPHQRSG